MASADHQPGNLYTSVLSDENLDEKITAQQAEIEKEIAQEQPLISHKIKLDTLLKEYLEEDLIYRNKITDLCETFEFIRKTRGDGNCFFRAFGFSYLESLIGKKDEIEKVKAILNQCLTDLGNLGYQTFTIEDFRDVFLEVLDKLNDNMTSAKLEEIFCDAGISEYIVVYMRLLVSSYLQKNSELYEPFIDNYVTMKEFCSHEVEPMYRESDHIHIIALTSAMNVPVSIIYLDRTEQDKATPHNFPEGSQPSIHILYRPGHYDILYKKN